MIQPGYRMYIDDGVSRDSAPSNALANQPGIDPPAHKNSLDPDGLRILAPDELAADKYCEMIFNQIWVCFLCPPPLCYLMTNRFDVVAKHLYRHRKPERKGPRGKPPARHLPWRRCLHSG